MDSKCIHALQVRYMNLCVTNLEPRLSIIGERYRLESALNGIRTRNTTGKNRNVLMRTVDEDPRTGSPAITSERVYSGTSHTGKLTEILKAMVPT